MGRGGDDTEPESGRTAFERPGPRPADPSSDDPFETGPDLGFEDTVLRDPRGITPHAGTESADFPPVDRDNYEVGKEFARGGLGRILQAWDRRLNRTVALKELLTRNGHAEGRFLREAMITARLEHPNIVPIHEAGRWPEGDRFYAMKLVQGRTLSERLEEAESDEARLALLSAVIDVCDAVAYAHSQGILHRDLKPSNVMLGPFGETVVIDWGLAKDLNDPTDVDPPSEEREAEFAGEFETSDGIVVGTPPYMPPEQAAAGDLDPRSDVYALGAILYHVLCGYRPYQNVKPQDVLRAVVSHPPAAIESLAPEMPRDLLAIVHKAMARDPDDRYPSAEEMAAELRRLQTGQMVTAHDYSPWEILRRFVRRQRAVVVTAALAIVVLVSFAAWSYESIRTQRNAATRNAEIALTRLDRFRFERARALLDVDPTESLVQLLRIEDISHVSPGAASLAAEAVDRGISRHVLDGHTDLVNAVAVSADGRWVASASQDRTVRVWDAETAVGRELTGHEDNISTLGFGADGRLASGSHDGTVRIWDLDGSDHLVLTGHEGPVKSIRFSEDGRQLASTSEDRTVRVWDLATQDAQVLFVDVVDRNVAAVFSPDGRHLLSGGHGDTAILWDLESGTQVVLRGHEGIVKAVAFSPGGRQVATADVKGLVYLHAIDTGAVSRLIGHTDLVSALAFSPDGRHLASAGLDRTVWVWDVDGEAHRRFDGHEERVSSLRFAPEGGLLVSSSWDRTVRVWDLRGGTHRVLRGHRAVVSSVAMSDDGQRLASGSWDQQVRLWHLDDALPQVLKGHGIGVHGVDFSPLGGLLASGGHDDDVRLWDLESGEARVLRGHGDHVYRVFFSADGALVASSSDDRTVRLWRVEDGTARVLEGHTADVEELAFSPDGRWLASAAEDNLVWLWDTVSGEGRPLRGHTGHVTDVTFTPDSARVVSSSRDRTVRIWGVEDGGASAVLPGAGDVVSSVAVSPDGAAIFTASPDGFVRSYDSRTGALERRYAVPRARLVRISPDGRFFAVGTLGPDVWLCRRSHDLCDRLTGHSAITWDLTFDPSSRALITGGGDDTVRLWDVETTDSRVLRGHEAPIFDVAVSADGRWVASASADTTVRVWPLRLPPPPEALPAWVRDRTSYDPPADP